jgi:hypothetical protein
LSIAICHRSSDVNFHSGDIAVRPTETRRRFERIGTAELTQSERGISWERKPPAAVGTGLIGSGDDAQALIDEVEKTNPKNRHSTD